MSTTRLARLARAGTLSSSVALAAVTLVSWVLVIRDASAMVMPAETATVAEAVRYALQWGVMMAAMMLPSAAPMILLYQTVSARLTVSGERAIPVWMFAGVYLLAWLMPGIPLYMLNVAFNVARARWHWLDVATPYLVAGVLAMAGTYQFSGAKRACLRHCESPIGFLMRRWKSGYASTFRLALAHAGYCIGCCWGLMAILVVAGAMSLPWVLGIALVVLAEKLLPPATQTARVVGVLLLAAALGVVIRPDLARRMSGMPSSGDAMHMGMPMTMPM